MGLDLDLLEMSFDRMAPRAKELVDIVYARLFETAPGILPLFAMTDRAKQKATLVATLPLLRTSLRSVGALAPMLREAGARYASYGVLPEFYPGVAAALLESMARVAGDSWTPKMAIAWAQVLDLVANAMVEGATEALSELDRRELALRRFGASVANDILARQRRVAALATI